MSVDTTARTKAAGAKATDHRWLILVVVSIAQLMVVLDATVINIALPSAQKDLGFANGERQWIVTAYALAFGPRRPGRGRRDAGPGRALHAGHDLP